MDDVHAPMKLSNNIKQPHGPRLARQKQCLINDGDRALARPAMEQAIRNVMKMPAQ